MAPLPMVLRYCVPCYLAPVPRWACCMWPVRFRPLGDTQVSDSALSQLHMCPCRVHVSACSTTVHVSVCCVHEGVAQPTSKTQLNLYTTVATNAIFVPGPHKPQAITVATNGFARLVHICSPTQACVYTSLLLTERHRGCVRWCLCMY